MAVVSSPADNVKTRIMNQRKSSSATSTQYHGIFDCIYKMIHHEGGVRAFYRGFGPQWARFAPLITIQLLVWEWLRKISGFDAI